MAKHVVFLVHGMGVYVDGDGKPANKWHDAAVEALKAAAETPASRQLLHLAEGDLDKLVQFEFVNYDDTFNELAGNWQKKGEELSKFPGFGTVGNVFQNAGQLQNNFFWTNAADVLMYRTPIVRVGIILKVLGQIKKRLQALGNPGWSIIAHSLGTSVVTDAVNQYAKVDLGTATWATRPHLLAMIGNVSRALQAPDYPTYASRVVPGTGCNVYATADHVLDPFTWIHRFRPNTAAWTKARKNGAFIEANALEDLGFLKGVDPTQFVSKPGETIFENNPHNFANYIANPRVHLPILGALLGESVPPNDVDQAANAYEAAVENKLNTNVKDAAGAFIAKKVHAALQQELGAAPSQQALFKQLRALYEIWSKP